MLSTPNEAEEIVVGIEIAGQLALGKLFAQLHLVQPDQQIVGEVANKLSVLPLVGILDQILPPGNTDFQKLVICLINNIHLLLFALKGQKF